MAILYTYYGDDFTGSTDVLEQLASNGIATVLFLAPPATEQLAKFRGVEAIGIAGDSRSRSPEWMTANLPRIFAAMRRFEAPIAHYKVCSTFDSSPGRGSIGRAIEAGIETFAPRFVPIVAGAPHLRRFVVFGQLFAAGPDGAIQRIDRHPMAQHPVTPMREADLRRHLALQTALPVGLVDLTALASEESASAALEAQLAAGSRAVLFDTVDAATQRAIGEMLWSEVHKRPIFSASSSGLTAALIAAWRKQGLLPERPPQGAKASAGPLLVVSGSCSAVTERQIRWALDHGFRGIRLDPGGVLAAETIEAAARWLGSGEDVVLYTALGPSGESAQGDALGISLGVLVRELLGRTSVRRVLLCGGDTSSHALQQLGLTALTWLGNLQPGAPLCRAHVDGDLDGLELVLKGGQVGTEDFFEVVRASC